VNCWSELENYLKSHKYGDTQMKNIFWNVLRQNSKGNMLELWFRHVLQALKLVHWFFLIMGAKVERNICGHWKSASFYFLINYSLPTMPMQYQLSGSTILFLCKTIHHVIKHQSFFGISNKTVFQLCSGP